MVATNEVCFLKPEDYEAHEARVSNEGRALDDPQWLAEARTKTKTPSGSKRAPS